MKIEDVNEFIKEALRDDGKGEGPPVVLSPEFYDWFMAALEKEKKDAKKSESPRKDY